jgi:hypothetical protein
MTNNKSLKVTAIWYTSSHVTPQLLRTIIRIFSSIGVSTTSFSMVLFVKLELPGMPVLGKERI